MSPRVFTVLLALAAVGFVTLALAVGWAAAWTINYVVRTGVYL